MSLPYRNSVYSLSFNWGMKKIKRWRAAANEVVLNLLNTSSLSKLNVNFKDGYNIDNGTNPGFTEQAVKQGEIWDYLFWIMHSINK